MTMYNLIEDSLQVVQDIVSLLAC